jgi:hypothetical protein
LSAAVLHGAVRDGVTGEPLAGASVVVDGTERGAPSELNGVYKVFDLPESTWTATASYIGHDDATLRFSTTARRTAQLDFYLYPTLPFSESLSQVAGTLLQSRLGADTLHVDTVFAPADLDDTSAMSRSNRVRSALLKSYKEGGRNRAAMTLEHYRLSGGHMRPPLQVDTDVQRSRPKAMLAAGKGLCFYRKWLYYRGDGPLGPPELTYQTTSVTAGYFRTDSLGNREFTTCHGSCPKDKWLVLKLMFASGSAVFF